MPYKYIGRTTDFKGKSLWEILGNLKNFGVGRIVSRNMLKRYPEPTYIKILKVEALPLPKPNYTKVLKCGDQPNIDITYNDKRKVIALVEKTFRGIKQAYLVQMESATYKSDYFLVPKHKEAEFCKYTGPPLTMRIFPREMEFPPLLKEFVIRQMKVDGISTDKKPKMKICYNICGHKTYRVAEEGETPTVPEPSIGLGKPVAPRLYENIKE